MSEHVARQVREGVLELRLNRPEKKNALTPQMYEALAGALRQADGDRTVRVVWITGSGDSFTSGNDVTSFVDGSRGSGRPPAHDFLHALATLASPLVASVNGMAVGVGATMLLHCDMVLAARSASFRFPFVDLGVFPEAASTVLLPRIAGHQKAMELFLLGDRFDAEAAHEAGMVNRICEDDALEAESLALARRLAQKPASALRATKARVRAGYGDLSAVIDAELGPFGAMVRSPEAQEAFSAFLEKRKPDFSRFG
ncbi:MAG: enoyl-CoA hydratase [Proteobacteria bacterium]|nr:enoyl-CoA hydratase [Pseudomonadota bacterium]